ncbi:hypothetical protein [Brucella anthropi]|uniref:hypothetical protein n=1 Tax=Brucella anthropi TaxID=529 RepID=UPI0005BB8BFE|nr:hypothetical protein [Brucella anthropi]KIU66148.1 hypothetical protein TR92_20375 [Brucella anthropi]
MTHIELIEKVAKAINGPFHPVPEGSLFTLDQLRDVRWQQINGAERNLCLASAQAAISTIRAALKEPSKAMLSAAEKEDRVTDFVTYSDYWRAMLAASAFGEQSE